MVKIGIELEGHLIDENGSVSNYAPELIEIMGSPDYLVPESSETMFEVNSSPSDDMSYLADELSERLNGFNDIANSRGLRVMPAPNFHNDGVKVRSRDPDRPRSKGKKAVLGEALWDLEHHLTATHVHVDMLEDEGKAYNQIMLMQAMDPVFAFASSSPFFLGNNSKRDYRVDVYRNEVFDRFPLQGQLLDYPKSLEDVMDRQVKAYDEFKNELVKEGLDDDSFNKYNCIWGPLRLTKFGTIEARGADSNNLSNVLGLGAVYMGVSNYLERENVDVEINDGSYDVGELFVPKNGKIIVPNYDQLKRFEGIGVEDGLSNSTLRTYLSNVLDVAEKGLDDESYLNPFRSMISEGRSFSDDIIGYASDNGIESNGTISEAGARALRSYVAGRYESDLEKYSGKVLV
ncbi:hypothetical protein CMI38_01510 [Candidatus Pacearchaeota archaeon]|nr:hypothetical protein [Candidatus Pacearchaeota archaeon]